MELSNRAQGRWHGILTHLGVDPVFLRNRNGPCPACGGVDRFRWDDKDGNGTFYCNGGGDPIAGDGFGLIKHLDQCDFPEAANKVEEVLGGKSQSREYIPKRPPPRPKPKTRLTAEKIWQSTRPDELISWDTEVASHPYAQLKGIEHACGAARGRVTGRVVGKDADVLIIPLRRLNRQFSGVEIIGAPMWYPEKKKHITPI
jgi:putative DNA primase/helicase